MTEPSGSGASIDAVDQHRGRSDMTQILPSDLCDGDLRGQAKVT